MSIECHIPGLWCMLFHHGKTCICLKFNILGAKLFFHHTQVFLHYFLQFLEESFKLLFHETPPKLSKDGKIKSTQFSDVINLSHSTALQCTVLVTAGRTSGHPGLITTPVSFPIRTVTVPIYTSRSWNKNNINQCIKLIQFAASPRIGNFCNPPYM